MKSITYPSVIGIFLFALSCSSPAPRAEIGDTLPASSLHPFGRTLLRENQQVELISSASHAGFRFQGRDCSVWVQLPEEGTHNYLQYELDGVYQKRVRITGGRSQPVLISAPNDGDHAVWIYKATEAHTGPLMIDKITGKGLRPLQRPDAHLIEFIGNSITCAAAADDSETPCGTGEYHDQHNAYFAYGPRMARALGVNFLMSSVSGIGIYRNWNSDGPTMPQVYEKADFQDYSTRLWDFTQYSPQIVSIALGTNDYSDGDGIRERLPFDPEVFVVNYIKFVQLIKSKYPSAQIALLSSPMLNGERRETLQNGILKVKDAIDAQYPSDKPLALFFFKPMQARGCTGHPSVEDHAILAAELLPFFEKLLKK